MSNSRELSCKILTDKAKLFSKEELLVRISLEFIYSVSHQISFSSQLFDFILAEFPFYSLNLGR